MVHAIPNSIAITCSCVPCHDWMSFASWYSIRKWLPDCDVSLEMNLDKPLFKWAPRVGVRISRNVKAEVKIRPTVMILREFNGSCDPVSSKSNNQASFIDYSDGCGNFVVDKWINNQEVPFYRAMRRFRTHDLTVNEVAILNFWERCGFVYKSVGG